MVRSHHGYYKPESRPNARWSKIVADYRRDNARRIKMRRILRNAIPIALWLDGIAIAIVLAFNL